MKVLAQFLQIILKITIMQISLKEQYTNNKPAPNIMSVHNYGFYPRMPTDHVNEQGSQEHDEDQQFSVSITSRSSEPQARIIRKSMVNRSCINTSNFSCRNLQELPFEITDSSEKLSGIQKIDLSFNNIVSINSINFAQLISLKELVINDNHIGQIPHHSLNSCRQLKLINLTNNQLTLMPPLSTASFILAKGNPLRLISAQLKKLPHLQFITIDWLDYLLDNISSELSTDKFKDYARQYTEFKKSILDKVENTKEENCSYCDFHCLFTVRMEQWRNRKQGVEGILAMHAAKAILRGDQFFLNYLRNFHNEVNYAGLTYNSRLLLETALETGKVQALDLFKLRKNNYAAVVDEDVYFNSLRACCKHSSYDIFKYLIHIRSRKRVLQTQSHLTILIKQTIQKYNKQHESDKILIELIRFWKQATKGKIVVKLPVQFSHKLFKSISSAMVDICQNQLLTEQFRFESEQEKTTPLHFAMRSRNQQLTKNLVQKGQDVFQKNYIGQSCKFVHGSTQVSRKIIWRRQKQVIKSFWAQSQANSLLEEGHSKSIMTSQRSKLSCETVNNMIQSRIGYQSMQPQFLLYRKPTQQKLAFKNRIIELQHRTNKAWKDQQIFPHLTSNLRIYIDQNWKKNYLRKFLHCDILVFLLTQMDFWKENDYLVALQRWGKAHSQLCQLFEMVKFPQDNLVKYQLAQSILRLTEEGNSQRTIKGGNFWCCQNVTYQ